MSVSSSIDLTVFTEREQPIIFIVNCLLSHGWYFSNNSSKSIDYLPVGDNDDFDWQYCKNITHDQLISIFIEKESKKEMVGIKMLWQDSMHGGSFLFDSTGNILINLNINRRQTAHGYTDVNWYLDRILPALDGKVYVETIKFSQHH